MVKLAKKTIIITLPLVILLAILEFYAFDQVWYEKKIIDQKIQSISQEKIDYQVNNLFGYFRGKNQLDNSLYTTREQLHLFDIKNILIIVKITAVILTIILILQLAVTCKELGLKPLVKAVFWAASAGIIFYLLFASVLLISFDQIFLWFHQIIFSNDFWQLDPSVESLIILFPPELFASQALRILIASLIINMVILALTAGYLLKNK